MCVTASGQANPECGGAPCPTDTPVSSHSCSHSHALMLTLPSRFWCGCCRFIVSLLHCLLVLGPAGCQLLPHRLASPLHASRDSDRHVVCYVSWPLEFPALASSTTNKQLANAPWHLLTRHMSTDEASVSRPGKTTHANAGAGTLETPILGSHAAVSASPFVAAARGTGPPGESGRRAVRTSTPSSVTRRVCSVHQISLRINPSFKNTYRTVQSESRPAWCSSSHRAKSCPCTSRY